MKRVPIVIVIIIITIIIITIIRHMIIKRKVPNVLGQDALACRNALVCATLGKNALCSLLVFV